MFDVFQKQCFAVFCGVLWCFAVFCVRVFSVFHKTAQNTQKIDKTHKPNTIRFVQYSAIRCCASFSHSENVYKKLSQNTSKTLQNIRKTPQNTVFQKTLAKHHKTLAKHPQNTAKHRKIPQNTFANKTDRIS